MQSNFGPSSSMNSIKSPPDFDDTANAGSPLARKNSSVRRSYSRDDCELALSSPLIRERRLIRQKDTEIHQKNIDIRELKTKLNETQNYREEIAAKYASLREEYDNFVKKNDNTIANMRLEMERDKRENERISSLEKQLESSNVDRCKLEKNIVELQRLLKSNLQNYDDALDEMKLEKIKFERLELVTVEQKKRIVDLEDEHHSIIEKLRCAQSSKLHGDERICQLQIQLDKNIVEHSEHVHSLKEQFDEERLRLEQQFEDIQSRKFEYLMPSCEFVDKGTDAETFTGESDVDRNRLSEDDVFAVSHREEISKLTALLDQSNRKYQIKCSKVNEINEKVSQLGQMIESLSSAVGVEQQWKRNHQSVIELLHGEQQTSDRLRYQLNEKEKTIAALKTERTSTQNIFEKESNRLFKTPNHIRASASNSSTSDVDGPLLSSFRTSIALSKSQVTYPDGDDEGDVMESTIIHGSENVANVFPNHCGDGSGFTLVNNNVAKVRKSKITSDFSRSCGDDDSNRLRELNLRNRKLLPHLRSCYPLETMKYDNNDVSEISLRDKENFQSTPINRSSKLPPPAAAAASSLAFYPF